MGAYQRDAGRDRLQHLRSRAPPRHASAYAGAQAREATHHLNGVLEDRWNNRAAVPGVVGKGPAVPGVMADGPRDEVGGRPDGKAQGGQVTAHDRKAPPLDDLAHEVGRRNQFEQPAARDRVALLAAGAEANEPVVGPQVYPGPDDEHRESDDEAGIAEPALRIDVTEPTQIEPVEPGIHDVEQHGAADDRDRHRFAFGVRSP